jgi:hypothetical protein
MVNSTQYRKHAIKSKYPYMLVLKRYWKPMLGTCKHATQVIRADVTDFPALAWFCYDFISYPFGTFSSTIISQLGPDNTTVQNIGFGVSASTASYTRS